MIHPRCVRGSPNETDLVVSGPSTDFRPSVRREVVEDQVDPFFDRIARAHPFEDTKDIVPAFTATEVSPELILLSVEKSQPLSSAVRPGVGSRQAIRV